MIDWGKVTDETRDAVEELLTRRGGTVFHAIPPELRQDIEMDLCVVDAFNYPLDFPRMLKAEAADLMHDIHGIRANLNRKSGKLDNCFVPRLIKRAPKFYYIYSRDVHDMPLPLCESENGCPMIFRSEAAAQHECDCTNEETDGGYEVGVGEYED